MEIRYRVYEKRTLKDITNEYQWVITPDGKLCYVEYDDLPEVSSFAYYEIVVKKDDSWEKIYDGYTR